MIIFDLKCAPQGHVFEAWFGSTEDYEAQRARGLVACPICGVGRGRRRRRWRPQLAAKGNKTDAPPPASDEGDAVRAWRRLQKQLLEKSDIVGDRFPDEARAIHLGEAEARAIHGRASPRRCPRPDRGWNPGRAFAISGAGARRGELTGRSACVTSRAGTAP